MAELVPTILDARVTNQKAKDFYFSSKAYCTFQLPFYFDFSSILNGLKEFYTDFRPLNSAQRKEVREVPANYTLLWNKNGAYAWRPLQLVNPAIYCNLVALITKKNNWQSIKDTFTEFKNHCEGKITCSSLPRIPLTNESAAEEEIQSWSEGFEQESLRLSLDFKYMTVSDITDCYGSIYTHTVSWALYSKKAAKKAEIRNNRKLLGNQIDQTLQDMQSGQTNGIPQGNEISTLIAEIILGYADTLLFDKIKEEFGSSFHYRVLRFRDDYRIFTDTAETGNRILLLLSSILQDLNFKINIPKTKITSDIISNSIKKDKINRILTYKKTRNTEDDLLLIREFSLKYPNSGSLKRNLSEFRRDIGSERVTPSDLVSVLIPIVTDIMHSNYADIYPVCSSIISELLLLENDKEQVDHINKIRRKFNDKPNIGYLELWLQRIALHFESDLSNLFENELCSLDGVKKQEIWKTQWLLAGESDYTDSQIKNVIADATIVDKEKRDTAKNPIPAGEINIWNPYD